MDQEVKKRGRPKGKNRRPEHKWDPKEWHPTYDLAVMLSLTKSNKEIAQFLGYSEQTISNILTSPTGLVKKAEVLQMGRDKLAGSLEARARQLTDLAVSRIHSILLDEDMMKKASTAFGAIDRALDVSRTFLPELNKKVAPTGPTNIINGNVTQVTQNVDKQLNLSVQHQEDILKGLDRLEEVKKIHAA